MCLVFSVQLLRKYWLWLDDTWAVGWILGAWYTYVRFRMFIYFFFLSSLKLLAFLFSDAFRLNIPIYK